MARRQNIHLLLLTTLWVAMVGLTQPNGDFPLNDDWVYGLSVKSILSSGRFQLLDWSLATGLPQAYLGALLSWLFGFSFTVLRWSTLVLGLGGVFATYGLLRALNANPRIALLGAASIAINPMYFALSNSFMTDVPFYALAVASLTATVHGFQSRQAGWLLLGTLISFPAILTRQFGLVLPLGFALAYLWTRQPTLRTAAIALAPLALGLTFYLLLQHWLAAHVRVLTATESESNRLLEALVRLPTQLPAVFRNGVLVFQYTGLFVLPSAVVVFGIELSTVSSAKRYRRWGSLLAWVSVLGGIVVGKELFMPSTGNVMTPFGIGPLTLKDSFFLKTNQPVVPAALQLCWAAITGLSVLGAALLADLAWYRISSSISQIRAMGWRAAGALPALMLTTVGAYVLLIVAIVPSYFDRYMLFCIPFALALLLPPQSPTGAARPTWQGIRRVAYFMIAASAAFSVAGTHDYLAWNRKRWAALSELTEIRGVPPSRIDGGYEFNGWHLYQPGGPRMNTGKSWWWVDDDAYIVASGPISGWREVAAYPFWRWLTQTESRIVILQRLPAEVSR